MSGISMRRPIGTPSRDKEPAITPSIETVEPAQKFIGSSVAPWEFRTDKEPPHVASEYSSEAMDRYFRYMDSRLSDMGKKVDLLIEQAGKEWQAATNFTTDGSGNIAEAVVYEHKDGYVADICQVVFWLDGQTPASVFSTANAFAALYKNKAMATNLVAYTPQAGSTTVFPLTVNIPNDVPPVLRMNDRLVLQVGGSVGGLANKNVTVIVNGTLKREIV